MYITRNPLLWVGKRRQLVVVSTYIRPRVFSTRIARTYASRPRRVTGDIVCSWNNRFHCLAVGVWPAPGADAPLLARYSRIRVYYASPPVITPVSPFSPLPLSLSLPLLLFCSLISSLSLSHFIPRHLVYSALYRPTGLACGRASAPLNICIPLNVVNLSKRGLLCAGSRAALPRATFVASSSGCPRENKASGEQGESGEGGVERGGNTCRAIIPNESTDLRALNGD